MSMTQEPNTAVRVHTNPDLYHAVQESIELFDAIGDAVFVTDSAGRILLHNATAVTMLGPALPSLDLAKWRTQYNYLASDMSEPTRLDDLPLFRGLHGEEITRQDMHISGDGIRNVWVSVIARPNYYPDGRFEWAYFLLRDINLRRWSEEGMRLHDHVMTSVNEGIAILDARRPGIPIVYVNTGYTRLTGISRDEALGQHGAFLCRNAAQSAEAKILREALETGAAAVEEIEDRRADGAPYFCRVSITPVHDGQQQLSHYAVVLSDITELIETQRRLKETTALLEAANTKVTLANDRMRRNLQAAAKVQQALLPSSLPELSDARFAWAFRPNEELSGDILNVIQLDDDHVALYLLDVTGHGVASAMLSVTVSRMLWPMKSATSTVYEHDPDTGEYSPAAPWKVATRLALRFPWDGEAGQFFTLVYGVLNWRTREFRYACAGHPSPVCVTPEGAYSLEQTIDLPVGVMKGDYSERTVTLAKGTRVYFYSDGIIDTMNARAELFGEDRLRDTLASTRQSTLEESIDVVMSTLGEWRGAEPVKDDISLLAFEV